MLANQRYSHLLLAKTGVDLLKFLPQPRTVRQRVESCQILSKYNSGYQDDMFDQISPINRKVSLLSTSSSLSEDSMSVTSSSSTGPLLAWPVPISITPIKSSTPAGKLLDFQHLAFIHKRIKEKKVSNLKKKKSSKKRLEVRGKESMEKQFKKLHKEIALNVVEEINIGDDEGFGEYEEMESYFSDMGE